MNQEEFIQFVQSKGWKFVSGKAVGVYRGYPFHAEFAARFGGLIDAHFRADGKAGGKFVRAVRKALPKYCNFMAVAANSYYTMTCSAKGGGLAGIFIEAMDAVTSVMRDMGLTPPENCPLCKHGACEATAMVGGQYVPIHRACLERHGADVQAKAGQAMQGNYFTGFLGAILGGAVGALPAVICMNFLEYYVALLYALIPLAAYHGYRICKGKMNSGALVCAVLSSVVNLFTVEYVSVFIQLGLAVGDLPTPGYAWRMFVSYAQSGDFTASLVMDVIFLALGVWITWGQIRRTAVHDVQDAGLASASLLVNGRDAGEQDAGAPGSGYNRVPQPAGDPWDRPDN